MFLWFYVMSREILIMFEWLYLLDNVIFESVDDVAYIREIEDYLKSEIIERVPKMRLWEINDFVKRKTFELYENDDEFIEDFK